MKEPGIPEQRVLPVEKNEKVEEGIFRITLGTVPGLRPPLPGQFYSFRCGEDSSPLLRRPLSVHRMHEDRGGVRLEFLIRTVGPGTAWLGARSAGDRVDVLGPLGNGFDAEGVHRAVLVARGIGVAPLYALGESLGRAIPKERIHVVMGARYAERLFLRGELGALGVLHLYTDDGSEGFRGRAPDLLRHLAENGTLEGEVAVFACGPAPMLREVAEVAGKRGWEGQAALETHMGCGIGACLSCALPLRPSAVRTGPRWPKPALQRTEDGHAAYSLICRDGPVYDLQEVDWDAWCA